VSIRLEVFDDDRWADQVADRWQKFMERHPTARLCLPTGDTPRPLYEIAAPVIDFGSSEVFLLDDFCLPSGDPARCDEVFQNDFLSRLNSRPVAVHSFDAQASDLGTECDRIERLIDDGGLDLTVLGLGGNGHLGLNEPGSAADGPTRVVALARKTKDAAMEKYGSRVEPENGMTVGMRQILASREIWLLVTGEHKAGILEQALKGPIGAEVPASYLRGHPNVTVFADESAARDRGESP
jgi:6-phosphogluconolactonase/glucosamine-6-phosphate isomerase/deaminase